MKVVIEIRPGEGGEDASQLVHAQAAIYIKHAQRQGLRAETEVQGRL